MEKDRILLLLLLKCRYSREEIIKPYESFNMKQFERKKWGEQVLGVEEDEGWERKNTTRHWTARFRAQEHQQRLSI